MNKKQIALGFCGAASFFAFLLLLAAGPGTVFFPNSTGLNYGVTFGAGGEYHSTTAIVDINNPATGISIGQAAKASSLPVTVASDQPSMAVNCTSGCPGSNQADASTFTQATTPFTPIGGEFTNSVTNLTSGQAGAVQVTNDRNMFVNLNKVGGTALVIGQQTRSGSIPVTIASDQNAISTSCTNCNGAALTPVAGGSAISGLVLKASAGSLFSVYATCTAQCWLMVFNSATVPANGATTAGVASGNMAECIPIQSSGAGSISYSPGPPAAYSVGISAAISSTACATLTLSTVGFIHGLVQ